MVICPAEALIVDFEHPDARTAAKLASQASEWILSSASDRTARSVSHVLNSSTSSPVDTAIGDVGLPTMSPLESP